jgi:hypothetical protein
MTTTPRSTYDASYDKLLKRSLTMPRGPRGRRLRNVRRMRTGGLAKLPPYQRFKFKVFGEK